MTRLHLAQGRHNHSLESQTSATWPNLTKRRDESRRGTHECVRHMNLPVHHRIVFGVVRFLISPIVTDFIGHGILIQFNSQPWPFGQFKKSVPNKERLLDVSFAERNLLLA